MKDPKALFPILFASSWLGNLLLTILAFYLAFTSAGPLTPLLFLTVAFCILAGNALPISVYLIMVRWREAELKAESAEASVLVRESLRRSEEILGRLDEAEGALAKAVLLTRQVPERIKESFQSLEALGEKLNTMEVDSFAEALKGQGSSLEGLKAELETLKGTQKTLHASMESVRKDVKGVPDSLSKLVEQMGSTAQEPDDLDVSVGERLDLVFETLETVQDSLDGLLQRVSDLKRQPVQSQSPSVEEVSPKEEAEPPVTVEADETSEPELEEEDSIDPEPVIAEEESQAEPEPESIAEPAEAEESEVTEEVEEIILEEPVPKASKPSKHEGQEEMVLESQSGDDQPARSDDGKTRIIVHAMIGMRNKLFIRGDEPWLSWDDGQQMELIGIGEFAWAIDDLKEPIEVVVLLNDEFAAEEGTFLLEPGKSLRVTPRFPKE